MVLDLWSEVPGMVFDLWSNMLWIELDMGSELCWICGLRCIDGIRTMF